MKVMKVLLVLILWLTLYSPVLAQASYLQSGPMVGYSEMREVLLWVQTNTSARVKIEYWIPTKPNKRYSTREVMTLREKAFTAKLVADSVQPGHEYQYELFINGMKVDRPYPLRFQTQKLWQWRKDPPSFKLALGSCAFINDAPYDRPGKPYGGNYEIFLSIFQKHPDLMLWLGDNVYLREPDWNTRTGILYRYSHTRSLEELQPLLGSVHHYAIWDDHDFGPNNSDRSFWNKQTTLEAFKLFWGNPSFGIGGRAGITTTFQWADVQFFLLDNRYYRSPNNRITGQKTILGEEQFEWLIDALKYSHAPFKMIAIGGQVLNPVDRFETYSRFPEEQARLLRTIEKENISGVFFLTGDRHHTELSIVKRRGTYPLYDLTVSPLTASPNPYAVQEPNYNRVPGTLVTERNFAILEFSGPRKDRRMKIVVYDKNGGEIWSHTIKAKELQ